MSEWYYGREDQQYGPIDDASIKARIATGEVSPHDLVWKEGMEKWLPLSQVSELSGGLSTVSDSPYATAASSLVAGVSPAALPMPPPTSGLAIASLVCGILAILVSCNAVGIVFGIPAVICGHLAMKRLKDPLNPQGGQGMALAGLICGYIGSVITIIVVIFIGAIFYTAESSRGEFEGGIDWPQQEESADSFSVEDQ